MKRSILRMVLSTLALVLLFAGSFNLNRTSASELAEAEVPAKNWCLEVGCEGGPYVCAQIHFPDGTIITCYTRGL